MADNSDAGGVAARVGFKYQDHVAASYVLQMIADRRILQVECETADDITLLWHANGKSFPEYIQVKSSDKDTKWSMSEICARNPKTSPTSLVEKSLLCDKRGPNACFRIVARTGVGKPLQLLLVDLPKRDPTGPIDDLAKKLHSKHRTTLSQNGHDLNYWTRNALWQVLPGIDHIKYKNLETISRLAEDGGANPTHSHAFAIYADLLRLVEDAALATKKSMDEKIITQAQANDWWQKHLSETAAAQKKTSKPYRIRGSRFFSQIHEVRDETFGRFATGYDAQYERKIWRSRQLALYLSDWVPEVVLKASELVEISQLNLRQKLEAAIRIVKSQRDLDIERLMGQTLLHSVLRHWFGSEPIACKIFYQSQFGDRVVGSAHIVRSKSGDELWLGRARFFDGSNLDALIAATRAELSEALAPEVLSEEREIILHISEPQHLTSNTLNEALERGGPVDQLIKILCLPILIAYDSAVLAPGYTDDYEVRLVSEIDALYQTIKSNLPDEIEEVRAHVFLIPVESLSGLKSHFQGLLGLP